MTDYEVKEIVVRLDELQEAMRQLVEKMDRLAPLPLHMPDPAHANIVCVKGAQGSEPMIRGKYVTVTIVVALIQAGQTPEEIVSDYAGQLILADIYDALSYYYAHKSEIDGLLTAHRAALERVPQLDQHREQRPRSGTA